MILNNTGMTDGTLTTDYSEDTTAELIQKLFNPVDNQDINPIISYVWKDSSGTVIDSNSSMIKGENKLPAGRYTLIATITDWNDQIKEFTLCIIVEDSTAWALKAINNMKSDTLKNFFDKNKTPNSNLDTNNVDELKIAIKRALKNSIALESNKPQRQLAHDLIDSKDLITFKNGSADDTKIDPTLSNSKKEIEIDKFVSQKNIRHKRLVIKYN